MKREPTQMSFNVIETEIDTVKIIEPKVFDDERGFFWETYKFSEFCEYGINDRFVQFNHSISGIKVLRGMHYQLNPKAQAKLVRCIRGSVFDVAVDIRKNSPTFLKWVGVELTENNRKLLYVPRGFAHGFCSLAEKTEVEYYCTEEYSSVDERGIIWNDSKININWPIKEPVVSEKDKILNNSSVAEMNFLYEYK